MEVVRVSALSPPDKGRSGWARGLLVSALEGGLEAQPVNEAELKSFSVTLPAHIAEKLRAQAEQHKGISLYTAGLIETAQKQAPSVSLDDKEPSAPSLAIPGIERVRPLLHELLNSSIQQSEDGKIVFAEAATGTGKGRMIASAAAHGAKNGKTVVVSAPLAVTWQLVEHLMELKKETPFTTAIMLGRPNFVSPKALQEWALENKHEALLEWYYGGGKALSEYAVQASQFAGYKLCWLLEDALSLCEDLPVSEVVLSGEDKPEECDGELTYRSLRELHEDNADIYLCSHYMLAAHSRQMQLRQHLKTGDSNGYSLPTYIDTLIVDEAHQLEGAFAAINSHAIHLRSLERVVKKEVKRGRMALLDAIGKLGSYIQKTGKQTTALDEFDGLKPILSDLFSAIESVSSKTLPSHAKALLNIARNGSRAALTGQMLLSTNVSPVRGYPQITIGRASLESAFQSLWDTTAGAILVSATLYGDNDTGRLMRWKLGVPTERAHYLPAVHPDWVFEPVVFKDKRVACKPDDSEKWADEAASAILEVTDNAAGGVLILCTSFHNSQQLSERLTSLNDRLIVQSASMSASACAARFKATYRKGGKPVWIGVGAAWTGMDISDESVTPEKDKMLTDLVVTRLPMGVNRTVMHERRVRIAGFSVVAQEASWHLRQGIGRLVRRKGVSDKNLWVLDSRIDSSASWAERLKETLTRRYKATLSVKNKEES